MSDLIFIGPAPDCDFITLPNGIRFHRSTNHLWRKEARTDGRNPAEFIWPEGWGANPHPDPFRPQTETCERCGAVKAIGADDSSACAPHWVWEGHMPAEAG